MDRQSEPKSMAEHAEALCEAIRQQLDSDISGLSDKAEAVESSILEKGEEHAAQIRAKILAEAQERVRNPAPMTNVPSFFTIQFVGTTQ